MDRKTVAFGTFWLLGVLGTSPARGQSGGASRRDSSRGPLVGALPAAWTSIGGLDKNGATGMIRGNDDCAAGRSVASVGVPAEPAYVQPGGIPRDILSGGSPLIDTLGHSPADVAANVPIDWRRIVGSRAAGRSREGGGPLTAMPAAPWFATNPGAYPTVILDGDVGPDLAAIITNSGRGAIVARGDLILRGRVNWHGLVLVGGSIMFQGTVSIEGALVTGLNEKVGTRVPVNAIGNSGFLVSYNSCEVKRAVDAMEKALAPR